MRNTLLTISTALALLGGCQPASPDTQTSYHQQKAAFHTRLTKTGPAPQDYEELRSDADVWLVKYPAGSWQLKGLLARPNVDSSQRRPALVYLHGGFALGAGDVAACQPFLDAGYVVFAPAYRGENGNPGHFELFWGEVDDAKAAVRWLARQPYVDSTRVYAFGHSIGGGVAGLLALESGVPMRFSGGSGGMYEASFAGWEEMLPFDPNKPGEGRLRVLRDQLPLLQHPHYAYLGTADEGFGPEIPELQRLAEGTKLTVVPTPGDHFSSLEPAMHQFLRLIDAQQPAPVK
ncbi:alpha/beta hydrolase family protein [Hymenobacter gummosus]|uniref:alpha/beta hydrolase family protein n=1 Tax=Hymenobacter gummosus TaxID=1776032 RepID=UPI001404FF7A|nr:alpha/beta hydrolase [Hymenobacter gummosus]